MKNKPCSFCGGEPLFMDCDGWYWVRCRECGVETPGSDVKAIAKKQWNRRVMTMKKMLVVLALTLFLMAVAEHYNIDPAWFLIGWYLSDNISA